MLEHALEFLRFGVAEHESEQAHQRQLRVAELLAGDDGRLGEVVALEQVVAEVVAVLGLFARIDLFGQQLQRPALERLGGGVKAGAIQRHQVDLDDLDQVEQRLATCPRN